MFITATMKEYVKLLLILMLNYLVHLNYLYCMMTLVKLFIREKSMKCRLIITATSQTENMSYLGYTIHILLVSFGYVTIEHWSFLEYISELRFYFFPLQNNNILCFMNALFILETLKTNPETLITFF